MPTFEERAKEVMDRVNSTLSKFAEKEKEIKEKYKPVFDLFKKDQPEKESKE